MAESSGNAVVDNAAKDSYFLMHIAPMRRKDGERAGGGESDSETEVRSLRHESESESEREREREKKKRRAR